jgi:hypothetical protein
MIVLGFSQAALAALGMRSMRVHGYSSHGPMAISEANGVDSSAT